MDRVYFPNPWLLTQPWSGVKKHRLRLGLMRPCMFLFSLLCVCYCRQKSFPLGHWWPLSLSLRRNTGEQSCPATHRLQWKGDSPTQAHPGAVEPLSQPEKSMRRTTDALKSLSLGVICYTALLWKLLTDAFRLKIKKIKVRRKEPDIVIFLTCKLVSYLC